MAQAIVKDRSCRTVTFLQLKAHFNYLCNPDPLIINTIFWEYDIRDSIKVIVYITFNKLEEQLDLI